MILEGEGSDGTEEAADETEEDTGGTDEVEEGTDGAADVVGTEETDEELEEFNEAAGGVTVDGRVVTAMILLSEEMFPL